MFSEEESVLQSSLITREFPSFQQLNEISKYLRLKTNQERINELALINETGITEIMWRFIRFHLEEQGVIVDLKYCPGNDRLNEAFQHISEKITTRIKSKQTKLTLFQEWLREKEYCRRELVLKHFGESISEKNDHCCDICGVELEGYFATENSYKEYRFHSWQTELKSIFHI
ncbi:RecQ family zinc-binding domain-containing protein [Anaerobacillus sp. CMMVII]|uniref:RecQ family zinc-binding domain-containing protein n=1 Tax=Anaerobacillus sp. CMMVII TaxID=2755588 RepID=UPI0021B81267|nr:RecQ family zinc-binding domain-containing protein [Anaerobacillus sp. CMMVII]MCT8138848.1 RecQ family zinc-binding domain-containing protein [Anaerobacillus sp. CMMVII]